MVSADVVVVGAGLAGLTAARKVAGEGRTVVVLEARDRVAGRNLGGRIANGVPVEMGGQWIGPSQTEVLKLISELGLQTFPTHDDGLAVTLHNGRLTAHTNDSYGMSESATVEVGRLQQELELLAAPVSLSSPWLSPEAGELDRRTLDDWLRTRTDDSEALAFWRAVTAGLFTAEPAEISLLHFLFYIKSGGMIDSLMATTGGAQELRVVGGAHQISERLAVELGDRVRLNAAVRMIAQTANGVEVHYDGGEVAAHRVVVTIPPALAGRLRYYPALPASRDGLTQQFPMGSVIKLQVAYPTPFWREAGLSGFAFNLDDPLGVTVDNSPPDGSCGILVGFIEGAHARSVGSLSLDQRRTSAIATLVKLYGSEAGNPIDYVEQDWMEEEYTRGCYGGRLGAGVWTQYGSALAEPVGRIHWAGAETSDVWNGYMEGAVRSGQRVADEVLARLTL